MFERRYERFEDALKRIQQAATIKEAAAIAEQVLLEKQMERIVLAESPIGFTADGEIITGRKIGHGKQVSWMVETKGICRCFVQKWAAIEYASNLIDAAKTSELSVAGNIDSIYFLRHHSPRNADKVKFGEIIKVEWRHKLEDLI